MIRFLTLFFLFQLTLFGCQNNNDSQINDLVENKNHFSIFKYEINSIKNLFLERYGFMEADNEAEEIKIKYAGGNAGHNGLRSISSKIGDNYWKLRIGISHPGEKDKVTRHVLSNFKVEEKKKLFLLFEVIYLNLSQIFVSKHLSNLGI